MTILMCLAVISCAGCFEENTASVYGNPESSGVMGMRLGTEVATNLEIGAVAQYAQGEVMTTTTKSRSKGERRSGREGPVRSRSKSTGRRKSRSRSEGKKQSGREGSVRS